MNGMGGSHCAVPIEPSHVRELDRPADSDREASALPAGDGSLIDVWLTRLLPVLALQLEEVKLESHTSCAAPCGYTIFGRTNHFIGCFTKNSHIRSFAATSIVDLPMNATTGCCPGQVCPPP